jgi:hypothetical protein
MTRPLSDDERAEVVEVLAAHGLSVDGCHCGWLSSVATIPDGDWDGAVAEQLVFEHRAHVADQLAPIIQAHYEVGLVEGSMIGQPDVRHGVNGLHAAPDLGPESNDSHAWLGSDR